MRISKIECPDDRAEGTVIVAAPAESGYDGKRFPYNTELANSQGVWFHVWLGDVAPTPDLLERVRRRAVSQRDVVYMTYSSGEPSGFWAHHDF